MDFLRAALMGFYYISLFSISADLGQIGLFGIALYASRAISFALVKNYYTTALWWQENWFKCE